MKSAVIAVAIPHCPWDPARVKSVERVRAKLGGLVERSKVFASVGPTPNYVWADQVLRWGEETGTDYLLQVQDDAVLCPHFEETLRAALAAVPNQVIALYTIHPAAPHLLREGHHWLTTTDLVTGVAWLVPRDVLVDYNRWRTHALREGAQKAVNEDTLLGLFCAASGSRVWSPIPTLVDHDDALASHYGNDAHKFRTSSCSWLRDPKTWDQTALRTLPSYWKPRADVPHFGRAYQHTHHWFSRWVKDYPNWEAAYERIAADEVTWKVEAPSSPE